MQIQLAEKPTFESHRAQAAGFTVLEMMVAMALFAIVLGSVYGLLEVGRSARFNAMESNEAAQDVRVGLNTMAKDVLNAGVNYSNSGPLIPNLWLTTNLLIAPDASTLADYLTPVLPGYQLNTLGSGKTDQVSFISTDNVFNGGLPLNIVSTTSSNSSLNVGTGKNSACNIGDLLWIISNASPSGVVCQVTGKNSTDTILVAAGDPMGLNVQTAGTPLGNMFTIGAAPATGPALSAQRITFVTYHVVDDGSGNGTGTLVRTVYGGNSGGATPTAVKLTDQPLAFDVTAMGILYYLANGTNRPNPLDSDFPNIRQLTVNLTVKSPRKDPKTGVYYTDTLSSTFNTRNLGYEKN